MSDDLSDFIATRVATANRPLLGLTVLVVEDSRYASEAMRPLCLRSGARIRRADCLRSAARHLQCYRPGVVVVDMGLPDGSGADLIRVIRDMAPPLPVVLATSGDPDAEDEAMEAGADGILPKPVESLALFQQAILSALPRESRPFGLRALSDERVEPDPLALRDDLIHMAQLLAHAPDRRELGYVAQFLTGVARSAHDDALERAASALGRAGTPSEAAVSRLAGMVQQRLAAGSTF